MLNKITLLAFMLVFSLCGNAAVITIHPYFGAIQKSFSEPAKTYLENIYTINLPLAGKLKRIIFREGDSIKKGQIIAQLDQETWIQEVNRIKAQIAVYQARYELQQKTVARRKSLRHSGFIDEAALDEAIAETRVSSAQIAASQADLAISEYNLTQSTVRASIDGTVLDRYTQGGEWLNTGAPLLRIGDLNKLEVICDVLTQEAQMLQLGDKVHLTSVGNPIILHGTVKQIYPAGFTKQSSLGVDEQRVNIVIAVNDPRKTALGLDYRVQAEFLVGAGQQHALIIPRFSVLQDNEGDYYVFKVSNNKLHKQIVKIGIQTDDKISILFGLSIQDSIVSQPTTDDMKV